MSSDLQSYFSKVIETREGFKANCPRCGDTKQALNWNLEKGVGCCFHASCPWYFGRGGVTESRLRAFFSEVGMQIVIPEIIQAAPEAEIKLPKDFKTLSKMRRSDSDPVYNYLEYRGLRKKIVDRARIGYCRNGKMWGYIIFPVFNPQGELVYWQGRRFKDRKLKFYNPASSLKSELVYQLRSESKPKIVIVVESIINALTLESGWETDDVAILATLGKGLSESQQERVLLYEKSMKEVWLALDPDALRESMSFAKYLGSFTTVRIPKFPEGEDVNSLGFSKAYKIMKHSEIYDPKSHMKSLPQTRQKGEWVMGAGM